MYLSFRCELWDKKNDKSFTMQLQDLMNRKPTYLLRLPLFLHYDVG